MKIETIFLILIPIIIAIISSYLTFSKIDHQGIDFFENNGIIKM